MQRNNLWSGLESHRTLRAVMDPIIFMAAARRNASAGRRIVSAWRSNASAHHESCLSTSGWCFDVCTSKAAQEFLTKVRRAVITSRASPWHAYFSAVYGGQILRLPFPISNVSFVYLNTPRWRQLHPASPSPFRDCQSKQRRCHPKDCTPWVRRQWQGDAPVVATHMWGNVAPHALRSVHMFSRKTLAIGRQQQYTSHAWIEVIRQDARKVGFQEAMAPPNCSWTPSRATKTQDHPGCDWAHYPPGCFMRPAVGSGIWINLGVTQVMRQLQRPGVKWPAASNVMEAAQRGVDTLQFEFGDRVIGENGEDDWPPLLVRVAGCVGRSAGIATCLPDEGDLVTSTRSGWHDQPCACDESAGVLNCVRPAPATSTMIHDRRHTNAWHGRTRHAGCRSAQRVRPRRAALAQTSHRRPS